jgi:hypothetical protein
MLNPRKIRKLYLCVGRESCENLSLLLIIKVDKGNALRKEWGIEARE